MKNFFKKISLYFSVPLLILMLAMSNPTNISGILDLNNLENYANQHIPAYITQDNMPIDNAITDGGATLGRVLFYDKKLSIDETISCASCHQQASAFSDPLDISTGVNGTTERHPPRLINLRFGEDTNYFWDESAPSLESLIMMPIQNHIEMGFSGTNGQPGLDVLFTRLAAVDYYQDLFTFVYGDAVITQERIEKAVAQFLRSIQSFDSKYDEGRIGVAHDSIPFANYTEIENSGKRLFLDLPVFDDFGNRVAGGAGCAECHRPPEFDIDPDSRNNGEIRVLGSATEQDITVSRSPTLRDLFDNNNVPFGGFMHNASMEETAKIYRVIAHYDEIPDISNNPNIDERLAPNGYPQRLHFSTQETIEMAFFIKTLKGNDVFTNAKWANPFDENGMLTLLPLTTTSTIEPNEKKEEVLLFPNPISTHFSIESKTSFSHLEVWNNEGKLIKTKAITNNQSIDVSELAAGFYFFKLMNKDKKGSILKKVIVD